jgi:hypothetical protein
MNMSLDLSGLKVKHWWAPRYQISFAKTLRPNVLHSILYPTCPWWGYKMRREHVT